MDGAEIVRRMQQFARQEARAQMITFDLAQVSQEALELTRPVWRNLAAGRGAKIVVETDLKVSLPVRGVASEIREVLLNMMKNAAEAMPVGGILKIKGFESDHFACITVEDTGIGMDEATRKKVFEPFFTTKGIGLGTGLGLSVAWGIIHRHNGRIEVESEVDKGTCFSIFIPLTLNQEPEVAPTNDGKVSLINKRILVVDDEELVIDGVVRTLEARGAIATPAENAEYALTILEARNGAFDLIISDHGMAGRTGLELLAIVKTRYPQIRRILLSGWGNNLPGSPDLSPAEQILAKPLRADELVAALLKLP